MKVLFLDFDGVLNSQQSTLMYWRKGGCEPISVDERHFCPVAMSNLQFIAESVLDLKIVISSTWRNLYELDTLRKFLKEGANIPEDMVIDITPDKGWKPRGLEIQQWIDVNATTDGVMMPKYQVDDFLILDDSSDMAHLKDTHFLQTDPDVGLTIMDARKVIERFNGEYNDYW